MDVFRVRVDEDILVIRNQQVLLRLSASPAAEGQVHLYLARPYPDAPLDSLEQFAAPIGEVCKIEFEGSDHDLDPSGTLEVTVAAIEGERVDMYLKVPDDWGAIAVSEGDV
jgi:hypothetical protein